MVEASILEEAEGLLIRTRDADSFYRDIGAIILDSGVDVETLAPADENVHAVYEYLIGTQGGTT